MLAAALPLVVLLAQAAPAADVTFDLRVERGRLPANMRVIRVMQGDAVTLRWTSDRPITLHLHGYDIEMTVAPGKEAAMAFSARATGRFAVTEHAPQAAGGHSHMPPLAHVEVRPR
jgi:hypothetical protein